MDSKNEVAELPGGGVVMLESDRIYFERRAKEETLASEAATHPEARKAHSELAARYAEMANSIGEYEQGVQTRSSVRA